MVMLSGGDLGGTEVSGDGWDIGDTLAIGEYIYRRTSETQAVFVGTK